MSKSRAVRAFALLTVVGATVAFASAATEMASAHGTGDVLVVGKHAPTSGTDHVHGCAAPDFSTITDAVDAAHNGDTIVVCPGTYTEDVIVDKSVHIVGHFATIDATGLENALQIVTSHVSVSHLTVQNANGEGILVGVDTGADAHLLTSRVLHNVYLTDIVAVVNDRGFNGTENGNCKYPGDCGGGIHFNVTRWSSVRYSTVVGNADGILLTDDYGPASHNVIDHNYVTDNTTECGIVLPGHNPNAVDYDKTTMTVTGRNPHQGGIYDNVITHNVTLRNGTAKAPAQFGGGGSGSGIGLFGSGPGTGVYDNLVARNYAVGNGLAGFAIHAHLPGAEDMNGNVVTDNKFGTNNTGGDPFDGPPGPADLQTTGVAVYAAPTVHMTIRHNTVFDNEIGIWLSKTVTARGLHHNHFHDVTTPIVRG